MFGSLVSGVMNALGSGNQQQFSFTQLPNTVYELQQLPEASLSTPFQTASLTVLALAYYPFNHDVSIQMLDFLKGYQPLTAYDKQFLADRFRDKDYVPRSYFQGANVQNNYQPATPLTITVMENPYSYEQAGYAKLFLQSSGADSPRPIVLRQAKDGKWYLWEQMLLADIRPPASQNPWV